jgi:hypothetical protein
MLLLLLLCLVEDGEVAPIEELLYLSEFTPITYLVVQGLYDEAGDVEVVLLHEVQE